jgi:hypothetical protein
MTNIMDIDNDEYTDIELEPKQCMQTGGKGTRSLMGVFTSFAVRAFLIISCIFLILYFGKQLIKFRFPSTSKIICSLLLMCCGACGIGMLSGAGPQYKIAAWIIVLIYTLCGGYYIKKKVF